MARKHITTTYYFAYGSNTCPLQMWQRVPRATYVGNAKLHDHKLDFGGSSISRDGAVANIIETNEGSVVGALYQVSQVDLDVLDGYEGSAYERVELPVLFKGQLVKVYTYRLIDPAHVDVPSEHYLRTIRHGYSARGIAETQLREAVSSLVFHVFVYGSLKQGFGNHVLLVNSNMVAKGETVDRHFAMYSLGSFPGVVATEKPVCSVKGELYSVDLQTMWRLDQLEDHPHFYARQVVTVRHANHTTKAFMYVLSRENTSDRRIPKNNWTQTDAHSYSSLYF